MPSQAGNVTESFFAVQMRPVGTAVWKRNHSVPGVQSRFHYRHGWSARVWTPARMMKAMKNRLRKCSSLNHSGNPVVTGRAEAGMPG